jgi:hypothetical protein
LAYAGASRTLLPDTSERIRLEIVMPVLLEPFWPSRRVVQFDELCRPAA